MKQSSWTGAPLGVVVLIVLTLVILTSRHAQATFTATGTSLTGDSNSTIDVTGTLGIGNTNTTSIILGQLGQSVTLPGNLILPGITGLTQCLQVNSSGQVSGTGSACGSGSTSPAGSNTQIQFNNSNAFGASANLTWVSPALTIGNAGSTTGQLALAGATSGTTTLQPAAAASGTLTLPAATGQLPYYTGSPLSGNCVSWGGQSLLSDAGAACGSGGGGYPGVSSDGANGLIVTGGIAVGSSATYTTFANQSDPTSPAAGQFYRRSDHFYFENTSLAAVQFADTQTNVSALANPPVMRWGSLTNQSSGATYDYFPVLNSGIKIIAITASESTNNLQSGCSTAPSITINDGSSDIASLTMGNGAHTWSNTGLSVNVAAGKTLNVRNSGSGTGCSQTSTNLNVGIYYVMQ
jgi:hypothetical protein